MTEAPEYFARYALYYDLIYQDKDYEGESDFLAEAFSAYSPHPVNTVLELGCGSGGHALPLARRGYKVTGVDLSPVMLERARQKACNSKVEVALREGDIRSFDAGAKFDACLSMFAVIGYLQETQDVLAALANARRHLNAGSLFIFDVWNGLAVMRTLPSVRVKVVQDGPRRLIRTVEPELDAFRHVCWTNYRLIVTEGDRLVDEVVERHFSRFFFPQEIKHYAEDVGFEVVNICPFLELKNKVDETKWNMAVIARAK